MSTKRFVSRAFPFATVAVAAFAAVALAAAPAANAAPAAHADKWDDALALIPADALSAIVIPSPKQASDDLQQGLERMGRAEVLLGGRPIDLLRAQLGIGAGFDDKGMLVAWTQTAAAGSQWCALVPVTDADAFIKSSLKPLASDAPDAAPSGATAYLLGSGGPPVFARAVGTHVLLSTDANLTRTYDTHGGVGAKLAQRLNARGQQLARSGDVMIWAGNTIFAEYAAGVRAIAAKIAANAQDADLPGPMKMLFSDPAHTKAQMERSAAVVEQISDGVVTFDFDALGVGIRTYARFAPGGEIALAIPTSPAASPAPGAGSPAASAPSMLVNRIPAGPFYVAGGVDLRAMGGLAKLRTFIGSMPMGDRLPLPVWLDAVQDKVDGVQVALYTSKLAVVTGGLVNDAAFVVITPDAAAVKNALRDWVKAQGGERDGLKIEATWEDARDMKESGMASAFAVKETVTDLKLAGGPVQRLTKQVLLGARGLHGLAAEVPGGLVVTFSQRPDVFERATKAARAGAAAAAAGADAAPAAGTLASLGLIKAYGPWLMPSPDAVVYVGLGELVGAAQQVAAAMPGGIEAALALPEGPVEPIVGAVRSKDGTWEAAFMVPSTALAVGFEAAMSQMTPRQAPPPAAKPAPASTAPAAAPAPAPAPAEPVR